MSGRSRNKIINDTTDAYIAQLGLQGPPAPEDVAEELINQIEDQIALENATRPKNDQFRPPRELPPDVIAQLMVAMFPIVRVSCAGINADEEYDLLAMYLDVGSGQEAGTYSTSDIDFLRLARRYNRRLTEKGLNEVMLALKAMVPRVSRCMDRDLIAVNNGIFDYRTKTLLPFSPDHVFLTKSHVDYNPNAVNVVIHNPDDGTDWDVESWISEIADDSEIADLLWEILGAIIRPYVRWNKSAWLYSDAGNNGKGTLCELMCHLCGESAYAAIPVASFSKDFMLEPLIHSTAVICHENPVGKFIDDIANLKAVITNDVIPINRKHKHPISFQFYGFMVQCVNDFPRIRDKSDSFYRRQLLIPFSKSYTGRERKYIKDDYINRPEVLEYVLRKVLHMDYYELSEPASCRNILGEYKEFNDPVRQFFIEMEDRFAWDLLPFGFLYDLYKEWFKRNAPTGQIQGRNKFVQELLNVAKGSQVWCCPDKSRNYRSDGKMVAPEPLVVEYNLRDWMNKNYPGSNPTMIATPSGLMSHYRGMLRRTVAAVLDDDCEPAVAPEGGGAE